MNCKVEGEKLPSSMKFQMFICTTDVILKSSGFFVVYISDAVMKLHRQHSEAVRCDLEDTC